MPDDVDIDANAELLRVLGHGVRLTLLTAIIDRERAVGDLEAATGVAQPMLSQQLGVLRKAGLVETRREAKQVFYRINHARIRDVSALLDRFAGTAAGGGAALIPPRRDEGGSAAMFARIG